MKTTAIMSVLVVFFLSFAGAASARVIKVPLEYASVQEAIDAGIAGDEVVVSPGTYGSVNFSGKALTVRSIDPNDPSIVAGTVIDAGAVGSAVTFASGEGRDSVLAGFTITGGTGTCLEVYNWDGGGVYCYNSSPTITSNVISGNRCPPPELWENGRGGGIFCWQSQALIDRNIIRGNEAVFGGGLISQESNDLVTNNVIHGNTGEIGGGVLVYGGRFVNNTVADNFAWWEAGNVGVGMSPAVPRALIANNIICFGWAQRGGGILWYGTVEYDNIVNNNVWDNAGEDYSGLPNQTGQNGNISEDPLFADPSIRDYHLRFDSPCINAGDAAFLPGGVGRDIDGEPRVFCTRVDIGADEYTGELKAVADAGVDQSFKEIVQVSLDGSGSYSCDPCGVPEFQWSQTSGPAVQLSDSSVIQPTFMPPAEAEYRFELVVSDNVSVSEPDEVVVVVGNQVPIADAGPNMVCEVGESGHLDGTGSYDPDAQDELTYMWTQVAGPNVVVYDANTARPFFDCNEEGLYIFELVVSDGFAESEPDVVEVITVDVGVNQRDLVFEIPNYNHYGDVSGTKVVYAEGGACDFGWDNECQDLATGAVYRWDEPEMLTTRHKIEGDIVVWSGGPSFGEPWYHEPLNIGVFARSLTTEVQTTLRQYTMSESYSHPIISGNTVVWLEHLNLDTLPLGSSEANNWWNTAYNVCGADITDLEHPCYFTIDVNVGTRDPYVCYTYAEDFDDVIDICGDIVVWEADGDIYGADISDLNDIRVFSICNDAARQYDPAISGNIVVWVDERNDGGDIYGADISDLEDISLFEIVKESGSQKEPAISGCIIVYVDVSDGLYGGDIRTCCLTRCHGVLDIELTGSPYGMGPAIDGSLIVWQDDYYGKGRGISLEVAYSIADGPVENVTKGKRYDYVQHAVNAAAGDDEIVVGGGIYRENVRWKGKNLTVRSVDPGDPAVVAATVIQAGCAGPVLSIVAIDGAGWASVLSGFTITGGRTGIYCSGACPIITNCRVVSNTGAGIEWWTSLICRYPVLANCLVAGNEGTGVDFQGRGNPSIINCIVAGNLAGGIHARNPSVTNCTVVGNALWGVTGAGGRIANCIIRDNAAGAIASSPVVTYSDIEGGWAGVGNMDADPCFVQPGYWDSNSLWVDGDYHLAAGSPCVDAGANAAVPPDTTDLDGDGNTIEPVPCDLDGNVRMVDGDNDGNCVVDIGAHEFFLPPIEVAMKFTPSSLNPASQGNWIKLHFVLPQGYGVEDVDVSKPAECRLMDTGEMVESEYLNVFVNEEGLVEVEAAFDRSAFSLCLSQPAERTVTIMGLLAGAGGQDFYGTHTIKIINNTLQQIAALASYWLAERCGEPDWCTGFDLDDNGVVNFADFALIDGCRGQLVNE